MKTRRACAFVQRSKNFSPTGMPYRREALLFVVMIQLRKLYVEEVLENGGSIGI
ncbi:hypothetical protein [Piscinibacter sp.]|uniref:hypothetical protein n=1 Tax=Piscinibacter sp. TaxID=1903157 RepID=UPI002B640A6D|nr:hypothetical protein [Albitalea sp.]HUG23019.1 hypothetical protein [Albitalea sp.]